MKTLTFKIIDKNCREFSIVEGVFHDLIEPLYGSQSLALEKIGKGKDRLCEALFEGDKPKGLIVYKKEVVEGSLELKTLCLVDPQNDKHKGFGSKLMDRVLDVAKRRNADKIKLTVSSESGALEFFQRKGFKIDLSENNKYKEGAVEHTITRCVGLDDTLTRAHSHSEYSLPPQAHGYTPLRFTQTQDKTLSCTLKKQYIHAIASGKKTHEGRVNTGFFEKYQPGRTVVWCAGNESLKTRITSRKVFPSFDSMLREIGFKAFVPEARSHEEAKRLYDNIPGYAEKVQRCGALALGVELLSAPEQSIGEQDYPQSSPATTHKRMRSNTPPQQGEGGREIKRPTYRPS